MSKAVGRPSDFNMDIAKELCARMATTHESLRTICAREDMPSITAVMHWLHIHEEFKVLYARAQGARADMFVEEMLEIADNIGENGDDKDKVKKEDTLVKINRDRLRLDARKWIASKYKPHVYGDKVALTGTIKHNGIVSEDQYTKLLQAASSVKKENEEYTDFEEVTPT